jgi:hypothetical protein
LLFLISLEVIASLKHPEKLFQAFLAPYPAKALDRPLLNAYIGILEHFEVQCFAIISCDVVVR